MGVACSTYRENKNSCRIMVGKTKIKEYLEDPRVDGIRILKRCLKNRDKLGANVNAVMNFRVTNGAGNFLTSRGEGIRDINLWWKLCVSCSEDNI